jgi:hypothetical protein
MDASDTHGRIRHARDASDTPVGRYGKPWVVGTTEAPVMDASDTPVGRYGKPWVVGATDASGLLRLICARMHNPG